MTTRTDIQDGEREQIADGERAGTGPGDRLPNWIVAQPLVRLSAADDPDPPSPGNGDPDPSNILSYTDLDYEQPSSSRQPIWQGRDLGWYFDGSNYDLEPTVQTPNYSDPFTVIGYASGESSGQILSWDDRAGVGSFARVRVESDRVRIGYHDGSNGDGTTANHGKSTTPIPFAARFRPTDQMTVWAEGIKSTQDISAYGPLNAKSIGIGSYGEGGGFRYSGNLRELHVYRRDLGESEIQRTMEVLRRRYEENQTPGNSAGVRIPVNFPANPDVWIDASEEPAPPADNTGDRRPTNLPAYSGIELEAPSASESPIWDSERKLWRFEGDDLYKITPLPVSKLASVMIAKVWEPDPATVYGVDIRDPNGNALFHSVYVDSTSEIRTQIRNDSGDFDRVSASVSERLMSSVHVFRGNEIVVSARTSDSAEHGSTAASGTHSVTDAVVGGRVNNPDTFTARETVIGFGFAPDDTTIREFRDYLAAKWGIV